MFNDEQGPAKVSTLRRESGKRRVPGNVPGLPVPRGRRALVLAAALVPASLVLLPAAWLVFHVFCDRAGMPDLEAFIRFDPPRTGVIHDAHDNVLIEMACECRTVVAFDAAPGQLVQDVPDRRRSVGSGGARRDGGDRLVLAVDSASMAHGSRRWTRRALVLHKLLRRLGGGDAAVPVRLQAGDVSPDLPGRRGHLFGLPRHEGGVHQREALAGGGHFTVRRSCGISCRQAAACSLPWNKPGLVGSTGLIGAWGIGARARRSVPRRIPVAAFGRTCYVHPVAVLAVVFMVKCA